MYRFFHLFRKTFHRLARKVSARKRSLNLGKLRYRTYEEALKACKSSYENSLLVNSILQKTLVFRDSLASNSEINVDALATILGVCLSGNHKIELNVLDLGGGAGYHYYLAQRILGHKIHLNWRIVETEAMVVASREFESPHLRFHSNIKDAKSDLQRVDLVFSSGALQYCPDPLATLNELLATNANHLFLTRTIMNNKARQEIGIQYSKLSSNGPVRFIAGDEDELIKYPITYVSKSEIERIIETRYRIHFSINENRNLAATDNGNAIMQGYFCIRHNFQ